MLTSPLIEIGLCELVIVSCLTITAVAGRICAICRATASDLCVGFDRRTAATKVCTILALGLVYIEIALIRDYENVCLLA